MRLLVLSDAVAGVGSLLPALELLDHNLSVAPLASAGLAEAVNVEVVLVDATANLGAASTVCRLAAASESRRPVLVIISAAGFPTLKLTWGFDDWVTPETGPAELETRLRLLLETEAEELTRQRSHVGALWIDGETYVVRLDGRPLDLTYREFELLRYLASNPARVFTRSQLLQEVWGYDYYGGTRTVDVHIRRLRAKLGAEHEQLIATVRGVGYKLDPEGGASVS
ncbi:MAG: winged helix-turn-helix transcriptional regulator [Egibacteraceae bacterium]